MCKLKSPTLKHSIWFFPLIILSIYFTETKFDNHWGTNQKTLNSRYPSSTHPTNLNELMPILKDYFSYEDYQKFLSYKTTLNVRTDLDSDYLKDKTNKALHTALANTFQELGMDTNTASLPTALKKNLIASFSKQFVKTLRFYKIVNGTFQIDLNFSPEVEPSLSYKNELANNNLINYDSEKTLRKSLDSKDTFLHDQIHSAEFPINTETHQYKGGQITIWIKLLDLEFDIDQPIPNPKANAVKGFVRFRRYFNSNNLNQKNINIKSEKFQLSELYFKPEKNEKSLIITADVIQEFNLANFIPSTEKIILHFGKLKADNFYRDGFFARLFQDDESDIKTGTLYLRGHKNKSEKDVQARVKKLIYEVKDSSFKSSSGIYIDKSYSNNSSSKSNFKNNLLRENILQIVDQLELTRFYPFFKENK